MFHVKRHNRDVGVEEGGVGDSGALERGATITVHSTERRDIQAGDHATPTGDRDATASPSRKQRPRPRRSSSAAPRRVLRRVRVSNRSASSSPVRSKAPQAPRLRFDRSSGDSRSRVRPHKASRPFEPPSGRPKAILEDYFALSLLCVKDRFKGGRGGIPHPSLVGWPPRPLVGRWMTRRASRTGPRS